MESLLPELFFEDLTDAALLALRITVAAMFLSSGFLHVKNPRERGKSIELGTVFAFVLGIVEIAGAVALALGTYITIASVALIIVMAGAIGMKIFRWKTGMYGANNNGWYYDLLLLSSLLVIASEGGGLFLLQI